MTYFVLHFHCIILPTIKGFDFPQSLHPAPLQSVSIASIEGGLIEAMWIASMYQRERILC
jgi:hypothetical protein